MSEPNTFNSLSLPDEVGNITVNQLLNDPDSEVIKRGNRVSIRKTMDQGVATLDFTRYDSGFQSMTATARPNVERKSDLIDNVKDMKSRGIPQKDIAFQLGISEAYVSKMLHMD